MLKNRIMAALAFLGFLALASAASAQTFPDGSGNLAGADRLRVPGCGRDGGPVSLAVTLGSNGAWTAAGGGASYSGTSTIERGSYGRRVMRLTLDATSLTALEAALEADASTWGPSCVEVEGGMVRAVRALCAYGWVAVHGPPARTP